MLVVVFNGGSCGCCCGGGCGGGFCSWDVFSDECRGGLPLARPSPYLRLVGVCSLYSRSVAIVDASSLIADESNCQMFAEVCSSTSS